MFTPSISSAFCQFTSALWWLVLTEQTLCSVCTVYDTIIKSNWKIWSYTVHVLLFFLPVFFFFWLYCPCIVLFCIYATTAQNMCLCLFMPTCRVLSLSLYLLHFFSRFLFLHLSISLPSLSQREQLDCAAVWLAAVSGACLSWQTYQWRPRICGRFPVNPYSWLRNWATASLEKSGWVGLVGLWCRRWRGDRGNTSG